MEREKELVGGGLGGEVNIEWREGKQVEVLVQDGKAESEESNGEAIWRQPTHHEHSPTREELASEDGINMVEVEVVADEGREEEGDDGEEQESREEREVEEWEEKQARPPSVSALSVSGEKILAHRFSTAMNMRWFFPRVTGRQSPSPSSREQVIVHQEIPLAKVTPSYHALQ